MPTNEPIHPCYFPPKQPCAETAEIDLNEIDLNEIDLNEIDLNEIDLNEIDLNEIDLKLRVRTPSILFAAFRK